MKTKKKNVFDLNVAKDSETSVCQDVSNFFPRLRVSLLRIQYSLYLSLLAKALLPTIYSSVRVSLLGDLPSDAGVNIASQVVWLGLIFEVLQEMLILPLYFTFGNTMTDLEMTGNKIKTGGVIILSTFSTAAIVIYFILPYLVTLMGQTEDLVEETVSYCRVEVFGYIFSSLNSFLLIFIELTNMKSAIWTCLLLKLSLTITLDVTFLSSLPFSLQLGVQGVAYTNIITEATNTLVYTAFIVSATRNVMSRNWNFGWTREWFRVGFFSGIDSLVRNLVYSLVILRSMNLLSEAGLYWTTNTFIWSFILLPFAPLSEVLRLDISKANCLGQMHHTQRLCGYVVLTVLVISCWVITIPAWSWMFTTLLNVSDPTDHVNLAILLFPFYVTFMFGDLMTSVMYSLGLTHYIALKSIIGNIVIGSCFSLTLVNLLPLTLLSVSLMFGSGLALGCVTTSLLYLRIIKKNDFLL